MNRQNLFSDEWDGESEEARTRHRIFWRPDDARMGATLYDLAAGAPETRIHMHFGAEEMFFVLSGRPVIRSRRGKEELAAGGLRLLPRRACRPTHVQQPRRRARAGPRDQHRKLPGRGRLPGRRLCMGGDSRSRSRAARERRRSRHHRPLRDPDRVAARLDRPRRKRRGRASGLFAQGMPAPSPISTSCVTTSVIGCAASISCVHVARSSGSISSMSATTSARSSADFP